MKEVRRIWLFISDIVFNCFTGGFVKPDYLSASAFGPACCGLFVLAGVLVGFLVTTGIEDLVLY